MLENGQGKEIEIEAQDQVVASYEKYGFKTVGQPFILNRRLTLT